MPDEDDRAWKVITDILDDPAATAVTSAFEVERHLSGTNPPPRGRSPPIQAEAGDALHVRVLDAVLGVLDQLPASIINSGAVANAVPETEGQAKLVGDGNGLCSSRNFCIAWKGVLLSARKPSSNEKIPDSILDSIMRIFYLWGLL